MIRDKAVEVISSRLGRRQNLQNDIINELQAAQERLEGRPELPWYLETLTSPATVAGTQTVAVPANFLDLSQKGLFVTNTAGELREVQRQDWEQLTQDFAGESNDLPCYFDLVGTDLYLFPTPDKIYTLSLWYYAKDAVLTTNIENNWLKYHSGLMIAEAGHMMGMVLRDPEAVATFERRLVEQHTAFIADLVAREESARERRVRI